MGFIDFIFKIIKHSIEVEKAENSLSDSIIELMLMGYAWEGERNVFNNLTKKKRDYITTEIIKNISNGICPNDEVVKVSNFNENHPMWTQYQELLKKTISEKKRRDKRRKQQEEKKIQRLIKTYGKESYEKSVMGEIFKDMNVELLLISKGEPNKIEKNLVRGKKSEVWYYGEYENRLQNKSYKLSVRLVEDIVVGWKNV